MLKSNYSLDVKTMGATVVAQVPDSLKRGDSLRITSGDRSTVLIMRHDTVTNRIIAECRSEPIYITEKWSSSRPRPPTIDSSQAAMSKTGKGWWQSLKNYVIAGVFGLLIGLVAAFLLKSRII